ncbi:MAG: class I SAM-dependent methyltransferase [Candidatus Heimdallarchaeaceae archaeon]
MKEYKRQELKVIEEIIVLNKFTKCVEIGIAKTEGTAHLCRAVSRVGEGKVLGFDMWDRSESSLQYKQIGDKDKAECLLKNQKFDNFQLYKLDTRLQFEEVAKILDQEMPEGIDFVFIDGDHSYLGIRNDFTLVYPRLTEIGIIAFHDTLRVDGCREFVLDLRTKFYDGTFDIVDFPFSVNKKRSGISFLVKTSYPVCNLPITQIHGSISNPDEVERNELHWFQKRKEQSTPLDCADYGKNSRLGAIKKVSGRKKFERCAS